VRNPYEVLGVTPDTSEEDIKKAYRKLALEWHPDRHAGDKDAEEKFKEINAAYQILGDANKRAQFDHTTSGFGGGFGGIIFEDLIGKIPGFSDFFNNAGSHFHRADTSRVTIKVSLEEAYSGCEKRVIHTEKKRCSICRGLGRELLSDNCDVCGGTGQQRIESTGVISFSVPCKSCHARGRKLGPKCDSCHGRGFSISRKEITINLPSGTIHGDTFLVNGLFVTVVYAQHPRYIVDSRSLDVLSRAEVNVFDAILGTKVDVPTLAGNMSVTVKPGTQPGTRLRIKGAGMKDTQGRKGNHIVEITIKIPSLNSKHQEELRKIRDAIEGGVQNASD